MQGSNTLPKNRVHRNWANAHHRAAVEQARSKQRPQKADPIVILLSAALVIAVGLSVFLWPAASISSERAGRSFACPVASVTDGDTLRCTDGTRVRLHAIAARESDETCSPGHPCPEASAASATAKLEELALGQTLQCRATSTSYNRVTAICDNETGVEINCAMVRSGTAVVWERFNREAPICG